MIGADLGIYFGGWPNVASRPPELQGLNLVAGVIPGGPAAPELCQLGERWTPATHPRYALGQVKLDGWRALYIAGLLVTREGHPLDQAAHSYRALQELERAFGKPMFFDGEYVHPDGVEHCAKPGGTIWLFDAVPMTAWEKEGATAPLDARLDILIDRGQHCFGPALGALKPFELPSAEAAASKATELIALGYEGLFVKDRTAPYRRRRHGSWRKVKNWRVQPRPVLDVLGRDGVGMAKGLRVEVDGQAQLVTAGFSQADRAMIWTGRDRIVGQSALIEFTGFTSGGLMRDASFVRLAEGGSFHA